MGDGECVAGVSKMCSIFSPVDLWCRITAHNAFHCKRRVKRNRLILELGVDFRWNLIENKVSSDLMVDPC